MQTELPFLAVRGPQLVTPSGDPVILRGVGLGGWMNMENFITGYAGSENHQRQVVAQVLGEQKADFFFDRFLEYFFTAADARYLQALNLNCVRLPINYRHFERDEAPFELREDCWRHLDRVVELCARHGLYTIIDLHAAPGAQNADWHSDNPTHRALFWEQRHFQERVVWLWRQLAEHYKGNPAVAGYDLLNEPDDPSGRRLAPFFEHLAENVRQVDPDHILIVEGNLQGGDFSVFETTPWPNTIYSFHDYAAAGFRGAGGYPRLQNDRPFGPAELEADFVRRSQYMRQTNTPMWVGEFGPMYEADPQIDAQRVALLSDQLAIYEKYQAGWSLWTYKDLGLQGLVQVAPDSPWRTRLAGFLAKKERLGGDAWGGNSPAIRPLIQPLLEALQDEFPNYNPHPFGADWQVSRLVRAVLLGEALNVDFAEAFIGLSETEIDTLMRSFCFEQCVVNAPVGETLAAAAARQPQFVA